MFEDILDKLIVAVEAYVDPKERLSIYWQLAALAAAVAYWGAVVRRAGASGPAGLLRWLMPKDVLLHPSAVTDYFYFVVNRLLRAIIYGQIFLVTPWITAFFYGMFTDIWGIPEWTIGASLFWTIVVTLVMAMVLDAALWFAHWLFHVIPELWEFHKVHHSAEVMTPITAARMHPVEEIVDSCIASTALGFTYAVFAYTLGPATIELTLFQINAIVLLFFVAAFNLRHSHVFLRYPNWLQHVFISPAQHQIHHSRDRAHWNRNMGFIFAFWDWAAGTLVSPRRQMQIEFGLGNGEDGSWRGVGTLYLHPFRGAWERLRGRLPGGAPVDDGDMTAARRKQL